MNYRWLKYDIVGQYSGIVYGKQNDQVNVISQPNEVMILVEMGDARFHVREEALSEKHLNDTDSCEVINPIPKPVQWMDRNPVKTEKKSSPQTTLF